MSNSTANVVVGKPSVIGGLFAAPLGTTIPTNESTSLNAAFMAIGYVTDDGLTRTRKPDNDTKKAWGGDTIALIDKGKERTAKFGAAEYLNATVQRLIYGEAQVTETAATTTKGRLLKITDKDVDLPHLIWVAQLVQGSKVGRIIFPDAVLREHDDLVYKDDDIAAYKGITLLQFPDSNGQYAIEYWNDGVLAPA